VLLAGAQPRPAHVPGPRPLRHPRENARDHLSFSAGHHYCLGAGLARLTAADAFRQLFPNLTLAAPVHRSETRVIRGAEHIMIVGGDA
jgi:cytochrome P450